jgi:hypothetical protein
VGKELHAVIMGKYKPKKVAKPKAKHTSPTPGGSGTGWVMTPWRPKSTRKKKKKIPKEALRFLAALLGPIGHFLSP